jgi:hypothetical protein
MSASRTRPIYTTPTTSVNLRGANLTDTRLDGRTRRRGPAALSSPISTFVG